MNLSKYESFLLGMAVLIMLGYFLLATPVMMDDGFHYEGFTESLARGRLDFKSFYGFQGLSILSVPIFWLTGSRISIIVTSVILYLLSLPLAYLIGRDFYPSSRKASYSERGQVPSQKVPDPFRGNKTAGIYFMLLVLLMPYVYTTMMRGFQEAALLFFILLVIYGAINKKHWTPVAWAVGGIVKPFALVLFPLFFTRQDLVKTRSCLVMTIALLIGSFYLGVSYYQTGHLVNNAAINSYQGNFDTGNPPPLFESFTIGAKGFLRVGANLLLHYRKILLSPLAVILGALALFKFRKLKLRREIILAILLNIILAGSLTFSFSKYLLPMVILLALVSVSYLLKYPWLFILILVDSFFVFRPVWDYFGYNFWSNIYIYLIPLWLAAVLFIKSEIRKPH